MASRPLVISALILSLIALILEIVAVATTGWQKITIFGNDIRSGLFRICTDGFGCADLGSDSGGCRLAPLAVFHCYSHLQCYSNILSTLSAFLDLHIGQAYLFIAEYLQLG